MVFLEILKAFYLVPVVETVFCHSCEQAVSQFKNQALHLCFSFKIKGELRKILIVTQPGRQESSL